MSTDVLMPREAAKFIAERSKDITLDNEKLDELALKLYDVFRSKDYSLKSWKAHPLCPKTMDESSANWVFVTDLLNFSFWADDPNTRSVVSFKGEKYTGYWSLCAAINRALDEKIDILNPHYYSTLTLSELEKILRSDEGAPMPMIQERLDILHQIGRTLIDKYDGKFVNVVKAGQKSAQTFLKLIVSEFPSLRDEATFEGQKVAFYKRAQILIGDLWGCFEGQGLGEFKDIDSITCFADYRVPQALAYFGVINYSKPLMDRLKAGDRFVSGERQEVELRAWTIRAVDLLTERVKQKAESESAGEKPFVNSILIDYYLWDYRRQFANLVDTIPMHKIRCVYY